MKLVVYVTSLALLVSCACSLPNVNLQNILNNIDVNDVVNQVNDLGLNIDQNQLNSLLNNGIQDMLQDKDLLSQILNVDTLLPAINNLTNLNINEQTLLPIANMLMNKNATNLSQIYQSLLENPQIQALLSDPSVQQSLFNIINNPQAISSQDLFKILFGVLNTTEMENWLGKHLQEYLPELASTLMQANTTEDVMKILEPIILLHIDYYLKEYNVSQQIEAFFGELSSNPIYGQLIDDFFYKRTLNLTDLLNLLQPLVNSYITDKNLAEHLFIYLPDLIQRISNAKNANDFYQIAEYLFASHSDYIETNLAKLLLENQLFNSLVQLKSVQALIVKLSSNGMDDLKLSDLVNIYLEYMKLPELSESQLNHLDIYLPEFINKLQSSNSTDLMSMLEPIISFHLNYYLNVNPEPLQNLVNMLLNSNPEILNLINSLSDIQSALSLSEIQYNHLFEYLPEFVYQLMNANDSSEIIDLIERVLVLHLNNKNDSVLSMLDELVSAFAMSSLNTTIKPMFNTPEFVMFAKEMIQGYMNGAELNQTKIAQQLLMIMGPSLMNPMKMMIYQLSPDIYDFAKDQSDPKVVVAYAVHAGESALHNNLRVLGIPYDSVYLGSTTTRVMTTTTPERVINIDLLNQLINLNKDKNDINKYLGNSGTNKPLVPFVPGNNNGGDNNNGGFDYF